MTNRLHPSISALHRRWATLENEHQELAMAIAEVGTETARAAAMRERQARVLLEIEALTAEIRGGSLTTLEDIVALLDIVLEHETDLRLRHRRFRLDRLSHDRPAPTRGGTLGAGF